MRVIKFTTNTNEIKNLSETKFQHGFTMLDIFTIKTDGFGSYLYEIVTHDSIINSLGHLKKIFPNMKSIVDDSSYNIVINEPSLKIEHKKTKNK